MPSGSTSGWPRRRLRRAPAIDPRPRTRQPRPVSFPIPLAAALLLSPAAAEQPRFEPVVVGGWTITDEEATCDAGFAIDGEDVLRVSGQIYGWKDGPSGGVFQHIGFDKGDYTLPAGTFPVTISWADASGSVTRVQASGEAVGLSDGLLVYADRKAPAVGILGRLPANGWIAFSTRGRELFRVQLSRVDEAVTALTTCIDFITRQKRPGTRDSGRMPLPPKPPEPIPLPPPPVSVPPSYAPPSVPSKAPAEPPIDVAPAYPAPAKPDPR